MKTYKEYRIRDDGKTKYKIPSCAKYSIESISISIEGADPYDIPSSDWMLIGSHLLFTPAVSDKRFNKVKGSLKVGFSTAGVSGIFEIEILIIPYVTYHIVFTDMKWSNSHHPFDSRFLTPEIEGSQNKWELFRWMNDREGHRGNVNYSTIFNSIKICHT